MLSGRIQGFIPPKWAQFQSYSNAAYEVPTGASMFRFTPHPQSAFSPGQACLVFILVCLLQRLVRIEKACANGTADKSHRVIRRVIPSQAKSCSKRYQKGASLPSPSIMLLWQNLHRLTKACSTTVNLEETAFYTYACLSACC
jgi:hypothetical protein